MSRQALKKTAAKKPAAPHKKGVRKRPSSKKSGNLTTWKILRYSFLLLFISFIVAAGYRYRHGFLYYLGFKTNKRIEALTKEERKIADLRIYEIVSRHKDKVFGLDVSHYQGRINWGGVDRTKGEFPLDFVFIRATAGYNTTDAEFDRNWANAKDGGFICGAYHYYRPNENSVKQAENFIKNVKLRKGDLPPVLDIEKIPKAQSMDSLKSGLKRWLNKVEKHYGVRPIIYSGESFYTDFLKKEFKGYNLWIANYSFFEDEIRPEWLFWQFTDKASVKGIAGSIDVNIYNGSLEQLQNLRIK
ncbi:MAG: glycoside hydrolase family 25 protein [Bacteroidota bacterium]